MRLIFPADRGTIRKHLTRVGFDDVFLDLADFYAAAGSHTNYDVIQFDKIGLLVRWEITGFYSSGSHKN